MFKVHKKISRKRQLTLHYYNFELIQHSIQVINTFLVNVPILYPLKTPENQKFSGVFRGYKMEH